MEKQQSVLTGKRIIVMGGSSGIGLATAQALATEGAHLVIVSGNLERVEQALAILSGSHEGYAVDLGKEENIRQFFEKAGSFDHLVYTAGENLQLSEIAHTDIPKARDYFNIRYWGALASVKYGAPHIDAGGSIVLTSGIAGARPGKGWSLGASICSAMEGFARAMAVELAPIRVNIVSPGVVRTNLWNNMSAADREQLYKSVGDSLPVKRVGEATDIAQTYLYLLKQAFGTGQTIVVDGGAVLV
jgi:NAD(P)-dependent dehydrogenase (short-subunit alcohol dehydrogenase family)